MVGEVALADGKQSRDGGLQLVVHPDTTHGVMDGGEDHHGMIVIHTVTGESLLTGIDIGNLLIHVEEVAIALTNLIDTQTLDGLAEVQEHGQARIVHTEALVTTLLGST